MALRTRTYDRWTAAFLDDHRTATVLHLGCGLDSRSQRVKWEEGVCWIDVDLPDVVALRRKVLPTEFPGRDYRLLGASVTDDTWLQQIPANRPTIVVMEGLLSYLTEEDGKTLLLRLVKKFREGGQLLFECISSSTLSRGQRGQVKVVQQTGAVFQWAVDEPVTLEAIHPRLKIIDSIPSIVAPGVEELPLLGRAALYALSWIPSLRKSAQFVRFNYSPETSD